MAGEASRNVPDRRIHFFPPVRSRCRLFIPFQDQAAAEGRSEAAFADQLIELSGYEMPPPDIVR
jgi:hypothetical protein